jgi:hypothetical protein
VESTADVTPPVQADAISPVSALWNVLLEPKGTFERLRSKRAWLLSILVVLAVITAFGYVAAPYVFTSKEAEIRSNVDLSSQQKEQQLQGLQFARQYTWVSLVTTPVFGFGGMLVFAGLLLLIGNVMLGGNADYNRFLTVAGYSSLVAVPEHLIKGASILMKQSADVSTTLGLLLPADMTKGFVYHLVDGIDLFGIWEAYLVAIGIAVYAKIRPGKALTGVYIFWGIWVVGKAIVKATFGSSFMF